MSPNDNLIPFSEKGIPLLTEGLELVELETWRYCLGLDCEEVKEGG